MTVRTTPVAERDPCKCVISPETERWARALCVEHDVDADTPIHNPVHPRWHAFAAFGDRARKAALRLGWRPSADG